MQFEVKIKGYNGYWFLIVGDKNVKKKRIPNRVIFFMIVIES